LLLSSTIVSCLPFFPPLFLHRLHSSSLSYFHPLLSPAFFSYLISCSTFSPLLFFLTFFLYHTRPFLSFFSSRTVDILSLFFSCLPVRRGLIFRLNHAFMIRRNNRNVLPADSEARL
jgi:hypothetical protein